MMIKYLHSLFRFALAAVLGVGGYGLIRNQVAVRIYQNRLKHLTADYQQVCSSYNEAVKRTAVTELVVRDQHIWVVIRTATGELRTIETPFNPMHEIYVDYIVSDGRLWIRRVYDAQTPPSQGLVINPEWANVDWNHDGSRYGKAVYRQLSAGRWSVNVSGSGSLGLEPIDEHAKPLLMPPPIIKDYNQIQAETESEIKSIGFTDIWQILFSLPAS